ncbi:MAG: salt stress protein, Slr1339 family [Dolichospermum sp.]
MDSIDKLLAEVKTEHTEPKNTPPQANLNPVKVVLSTNKSDLLIDKLLSDVQADFLEKDAAEALRKQEELIQEKIRQEKLKAKQREALEKPAKEWLAKLDPLSSEGLWFERFAQGYPAKLAAAIDYLQTNS